VNLGLVMGGGGLVGIAWELGVLAGLQEAADLDPTSAAVIVGSSAGSVSGAQAALGRDLVDLVDRQLRTGLSASGPTEAGTAGSRTAPDGDRAGTVGQARSVPPEILEAMMSSAGSIEERAAKIGHMAMEADVPMEEDAYLESFRSFLGTDGWPGVDLRVTTAEAETGRSVLWSRDDGIDLVRAVASSCAIPCFFPPVSFRGKHYVDGPRGGYMARLAGEKALDGILFVGPNAAMPPQLVRQVELEELADKGMPVVMITGGEVVASIGMDLMNPAMRAKAAEAGVADGRQAAVQVKALLR
jgi:NTE family protein